MDLKIQFDLPGLGQLDLTVSILELRNTWNKKLKANQKELLF